jgi:hypothetical protein
MLPQSYLLAMSILSVDQQPFLPPAGAMSKRKAVTRIHRPTLVALWIGLGGAMNGACGSAGNTGSMSPAAPSPVPTITSLAVGVMRGGPIVGVGEATQAVAFGFAASGSSETDVTAQTTWQSSDAAVAIVSPRGAIVAVGRGHADIVGQYQGLKASFNLQVFDSSDVSAFTFVQRPLADLRQRIGHARPAGGAHAGLRVCAHRPEASCLYDQQC